MMKRASIWTQAIWRGGDILILIIAVGTIGWLQFRHDQDQHAMAALQAHPVCETAGKAVPPLLLEGL